jgi:signal transduction histidine kinase
MIERQASAILQKPITPVLSAEEGVESVVVSKLIQERMSRLWQAEPYKSVGLELDLEPAQGATVRASADWLRRVLDVLVDNAVKAVSQSPVKRVSITARRARAHAEISISDTGVGIPEEISAKIFKSPIKESTSAKGMGMGLLMASAILQTYGGELRVGHTAPTGTTMIIELPLEAQAAS